MVKRARKIANAVVIAFAAVISSYLFVWWLGCAVLLLGVVFLFRPEPVDASLQPESSKDEKADQELLKWHEREVTRGPSAPGIANPSRRDD